MALGKGREVADAFIDIHGDLSNFRKELDNANEDMAKLARQNADSFTEEWGKRMAAGVDRQWGSILDSVYDAGPIDMNKLVKDFNAKGLDDAEEKINSFLLQMSRHRKINGDLYQDVKKQLNEAIAATRAAEQAEEALASQRIRNTMAYKDMVSDINEGLREQAERRSAEEKAWERANRDMVAQFKEIRKAYDESFDGMFETEQAKRLTEDLKAMVKAMSDADWTKFAKGFDSLDDMRERVASINEALFDQGRITAENYEELTRSSNAWIDAEQDRQRLIIENARLSKEASEEEKRLTGEALTAAREAREEQERWNRSLEGLVEKATIRKIERDFDMLADAIARSDWSSIAKGHKDLDEMRADVMQLAEGMRDAGRLSDEMLDGLAVDFERMSRNADAYNIRFASANERAKEHNAHLGRSNVLLELMGRGAENVGRKLAGMVGLNVIADVLQSGSQFMAELDRNILKLGKMGTVIAGIGSGITGLLGGMVTVGADLAKTLGGLGLFAPGFLTGFGIGVGVLVAAFKDMKKVLADLGPGFDKLQDTISASFWKQAEQPIRRLTNTMLPLLNDKLALTSENLGGMFKEFAETLDNEETVAQAGRMFDRMNSAIKITQGMVRPLTNAFVTLADYGSLYFERFGTWLVDISNQFNDFIQTAAANGDLQRWMDETIQGMKDLWSIGGSVIDIFRSINDAATMAGSTGLHGFRLAMEDIAETMRSPRFVMAMTQVFDGVFEVLQGIKRGLIGLGDDIEAFLPTYQNVMGQIAQIFEKAFGFIGDFLSNKTLQKGLQDFFGGLNKAMDNLKPSMDPLASSLGNVLSLMGKVADVGSRLLNDVFTKLGPEFDDIVKAIEPLITPAADLAGSVIDSLKTLLDTLGDDVLPPLVKVFENLAPAVEQAVKHFTPKLNKTLEDLGVVLGPVAEGIRLVADAMAELDKQGGAWKPLGDLLKIFDDGTLTSVFNPIQGLGSNLGKWIGEWITGGGIQEAWDGFVGWWNGLWGGFEGMMNDAETNIEKWWDEGPGSFWDDTVGKWLDDARRTIEDAWNGFMEWIGSFFGGGEEDSSAGGGAFGGRSVGTVVGLEDLESPDAWSAFWTTVQGHITTFFEGIGSWIEEQGAILKLGWDTFWGGWNTKVEEVWNGFWMFIVEKYTEITTGLTTWWTNLKLGWDTFWDGARTKVEDTWNGIWLWISTKYTEIKTGIDTWILAVKLAWDTFWTGVRTKVEETWNAAKLFIDTKTSEVRTNIDTFITNVRTNWNNFWTGIGNTVRDAWVFITNWVNQKILEIRVNIATKIAEISNAWNLGWTTLGRIVDLAWIVISNAVKVGVDNVVNWVKDLPNKIRNYFNVDLSGNGSSIMGGFLRGLQSRWGEITSFVSGIAEWIKNNKGPIEYDRVLLTPAGRAIMAGLVGGLQDGMADLVSQVELVTATMRDKITESLAVSAMYRAGADAALGLADGLASQKDALANTFDSLLPDVKTIPITASGGFGEGVGTTTPSKVIQLGEGAIQVTPLQADPGLVALKVVDELVEATTTL